MMQNCSFLEELCPWEDFTEQHGYQTHCRPKKRESRQRTSKAKSKSTKSRQPKTTHEPKHLFQPLMINVVSLPRLVHRQREDLRKLLEKTSSQMRTTKIIKCNLIESHIRHKRKLSKGCTGLGGTLKKLKILTGNRENTSPSPPSFKDDITVRFEVRRRLAQKFNHSRMILENSRLTIGPL